MNIIIVCLFRIEFCENINHLSDGKCARCFSILVLVLFLCGTCETSFSGLDSVLFHNSDIFNGNSAYLTLNLDKNQEASRGKLHGFSLSFREISRSPKNRRSSDAQKIVSTVNIF